MTSVLPWSLIVVATVLLATGLLAFWQSLRAAFGLSDVLEVESEGDEDERRSLLQQKDALLENLQDLAFEHEAGKISDEDFRVLEGRLRAQAKGVLLKLDEDVAAYREKAEALVANHLAALAVDIEPIAASPEKESGAAAGRPADEGAQRVSVSIGFAAEISEPKSSGSAAPGCVSCGTVNDPDAVFCKKCGAKLGGTAASGGSEEAGA